MVVYNYAFVGILLLGAIAFALAPLLVVALVAPRKRSLAKSDTYECGVRTYGETWVRFGIRDYIYAMVWGERKVAARFQDRIGSNRVGPLGLLQPIADAIKLLTKESIVPRAADVWVHFLAPVFILVSAFLVLAVIPFGMGSSQADHPG